VRVTETQLPRALSILDALFRAVEERDVRVTWPKEEGAALTLDCGSVKLGLCLSEILNSKPHVVTPEEEARKKRDWAWSPPKRDYEATGLLRIALLCGETFAVRAPPCSAVEMKSHKVSQRLLTQFPVYWFMQKQRGFVSIISN
jgi:hypothetical protein